MMMNQMFMVLMMGAITTASTAIIAAITGLCNYFMEWHYPDIVERYQRKYNTGLAQVSFEYQAITDIHGRVVNRGDDQIFKAVIHDLQTRSLNFRSATYIKSMTPGVTSVMTPSGMITVDDMTMIYTDITADAKSSSADVSTRIETMRITSRTKTVREIAQYLDNCDAQYKLACIKPDTRPELYIYKQMPRPPFSTANLESRYIRYENHNLATIDDLFIPDKAAIMDFIDRYKNGDLSKLSFLLHGIPGCGKTTFIKALAKYLHYDVIEIKLSMMADDGQLIDTLHNTVIRTTQDYASLKTDTETISVRRRIFVLEDVDGECQAIHSRANANADLVITERTLPLTTSEVIDAIHDGTATAINGKTVSITEPMGVTLAGVLNALDGILELRGVVIMTTNCIEKLDPALIRPGRVNKIVHLTSMASCDAHSLIARRWPHFWNTQRPCIPDNTFTPAALDGLCQYARDESHLASLIQSHLSESRATPEKEEALDVAQRPALLEPIILDSTPKIPIDRNPHPKYNHAQNSAHRERIIAGIRARSCAAEARQKSYYCPITQDENDTIASWNEITGRPTPGYEYTFACADQ